MNPTLAFAVIAEAATGVALVIAPSVVARLLFGVELSGIAVVVGRIAGISLISLSLACWPGNKPSRATLIGMATYDLLVAIYFLWIGLGGEWVGILLWPAAVFHAVLAALLPRSWPKGP